MSSPDGEHPPGLFAYMALFVDYYIFPGKFCCINHQGILNRKENLKYAHVLVDMEMNITLLVIRRFWRVFSTPGPIIRAIRYGVSIGYAAEVCAELRGHKETPRNPCRISGSDIL